MRRVRDDRHLAHFRVEVIVHCRQTASVLLIGLLAVSAAAQDAPAVPSLTRATFIATMDAEYRKLDTNGDQIVSKNEIETNQRARKAAEDAQRARAQFAQIDADRNGQVSVDEYIRATARQIQFDGTAIMGRLDANRDQKVTLVEYRILTLRNFDGIDADRDGVITATEQRASMVAR